MPRTLERIAQIEKQSIIQKVSMKKKTIKKAKKVTKKEAKKALKRIAASNRIEKKAKEKSSKKLSAKALEHKADLLLGRGKERGFVTYDEILKEFPNVEDDIV